MSIRTPGGPLGGPKGPKMANIDPRGGHPEAILGPLGPPGGPPRALILVYHFIQLPLHKRSVKIVKICCQSELDGSKIEKNSRFWSILAIFGPLRPLCLAPRGPLYWAPRGLHSCLSFSITPFALEHCNNNDIFYPTEMDGTKS